MTLNGAIMQLVEMRENSMMPVMFKPYFDKVIETISECVEPSEIPHWISCEERLPEVCGRYLVTRGLNACGSLWNRIYIANYSNLMGIKSVKIWWQGNVGKSDFERLDDVLAWMPLPEAYREGES